MAAPIILCDTAGMTNARWLECRMHGPKGDIPYTIGGSDVAAIFGVSPWVTPLELWMIKKGKMKPPPKANANTLEMGHMLEDIAAYWYGKKTGNTVINDTNMYQHADFPFALADFDRRFIRASDGERGILECKSCSWRVAKEWDNNGYPYNYELQLRFYLAVADVNHGAFSAVWGNNPDQDLALPTLERDKVIEDMIFDKLERWIWSLEHDVPPTMDKIPPTLALKSLANIYPRSDASLPTLEFPMKYEPDLRRMSVLQTEIGEYQEKIKIRTKEFEALSVRFAEIMKEHEKAVLETTSDKLLIDFATRVSNRTDTTALKKNHPLVYADVVKASLSRKMKVSVQPL